jgi:hypothetical protein
MGTGLLAPFYRAARRLNGAIRDDVGILTPVAGWSEARKSALATGYAYRARADIALDVCTAYPGGDYFEFGSSGLGTFRSFLAAFDINSGHTKHFSDVRFWAFDIFGNPDHGNGPPTDQRHYFEGWRNPPELAAPRDLLKPYGALAKRCEIIAGYFQDTLNEAFKARLRAERRRIGFAFLDCSIKSSYKLVFDFLLDVATGEKMFVYIDEYFTDPPIAELYDEFADNATVRHRLRSVYMRNAGSFGALFCLMPMQR